MTEAQANLDRRKQYNRPLLPLHTREKYCLSGLDIQILFLLL